jgi:hypothetical protein
VSRFIDWLWKSKDLTIEVIRPQLTGLPSVGPHESHGVRKHLGKGSFGIWQRRWRMGLEDDIKMDVS